MAELISSGADVNTLTSYGCTALHLAIALGEMGCFRQLLRAQDIAINCSTADGNTPLHWAVWYGLTEVQGISPSKPTVNLQLLPLP